MPLETSASDAATPGMVARQGGRDRITGRQSPTCAQHQWPGRIEILSVNQCPRRPIRACSHSSSHPHSCSGITSILTDRPYCGCCAVSACGLAVAIPANVLDPRMPPFSMHICCRRLVSNVHRCTRAVLPKAARCVFLFLSCSILLAQFLVALHKSCSAPSPNPLRNPLETLTSCITSLPEATKDRTPHVRGDGRPETNAVAPASHFSIWHKKAPLPEMIPIFGGVLELLAVRAVIAATPHGAASLAS